MVKHFKTNSQLESYSVLNKILKHKKIKYIIEVNSISELNVELDPWLSEWVQQIQYKCGKLCCKRMMSWGKQNLTFLGIDTNRKDFRCPFGKLQLKAIKVSKLVSPPILLVSFLPIYPPI